MKKIILISSVALAIILSAGMLFSQQSQEDQQKATEAYMKAMAVTENHVLLKYFVGKWDVASTMWQFPGNPPETSRNTSESLLIMGGRFLMEKFSGTMMNMPFEGMRIAGYDNIQKKFLTFWIDNTSTAFFLLTGTYDPATKTWTDIGKWADPMGGTMPVRMVTRILGPDECIQEMYMGLPDGKEFKSMEDRYTRVK